MSREDWTCEDAVIQQQEESEMKLSRYACARQWIYETRTILCGIGTREIPYHLKSGHQDLVTEIDSKIEKFFREKIFSFFPGDAVIGEELGGKTGDSCWYIDPLDGTTNFVNQGKNYAISVAYYYEGKPEFGLIMDVAAGELYSAQRGCGSFCNDIAIHVSNRKYLEETIFYTPVVQHTFLEMHNRQEKMLELAHRVRAVRSLGSVALELCALASGCGELFVAMKASPWDYNAARLILEETGGFLCTFEGEQIPVDYSGPIVAVSQRDMVSALTGKNIE